MTRVLIVDDSEVTRQLLAMILSTDPDIEVAGTAGNGREAVAMVSRIRPDIVTMDILMPGMDGLEATHRIMTQTPVPIVIVSTYATRGETDKTFKAMALGALAVIEKPSGMGHPDHEAQARRLVQMVKLMSTVKVVKRWARPKPAHTGPLPSRPVAAGPSRHHPAIVATGSLIAMGASTGGPQVLQEILSNIPRDLRAPLLIVQHISPGFLGGFADWLATTSGIPVHIGEKGVRVRPGHAYLAPDGYQMGITDGGLLRLSTKDTRVRPSPSISHLFESVAAAYAKRAVGVLLTGMGADGADTLGLIRKRGGMTIVQDAPSCVVSSMPDEAVKQGAATLVLPPAQIAAELGRLAGGKTRTES